MSLQPGPEFESPPARTEFERAGEEKPLTLWQEFGVFIVEYKAWWMVPIVIVLGLLSGLIMLGSTGAAPFIYTLF